MEEELDIDEEPTAEQRKNKGWDNIKPYQFKPGQSGNPSGRPKGTVSLKEYAKKYLRELDDAGKLEFLKGIDKHKIWEMSEDKAGQAVELSGEITSKIIAIDE